MVHLKSSESEAIALAIHSREASGVLGSTQSHHIARSASGKASVTDNKRLMKNDLVKCAIDKCTYELAITQQRLEIQRAMALARQQQSTPSRSLRVPEPGQKSGAMQHCDSSLSKFLAAYGGGARRARSVSGCGSTSDEMPGFASSRGTTLLTGNRVERLQREISMRTIAAIITIQVKFRKKLARKAAEEEARMRVKREIRRLRRSATESMLRR